MDELIKFIQDTIRKYPKIKQECIDLFQLCRDEIYDGESAEDEIEKCKFEIIGLIADYKE